MSAKPIRMCIGCRTKRSKQDLQRLVIDNQGLLVRDEKQRLSGRGAYVCFDQSCMTLALKRKDLSRIFKKPVKRLNSGKLCPQGEEVIACQN